MINYLIVFLLIASPCLAGMGIGGFPYPGPGAKEYVTSGPAAYDNFTGTDGTALTSHTSDSSHTWSKVGTGIASINAAGQLVFTSDTSQTNYYNSFVPTDADYSVFGTIWVATSNKASMALGGRISSSQNTGIFVAYLADTGWRAWNVTNGSPAQLGSDYAGNAPTTAAIVEVKMAGTNVTVLIDGVSRITGTTAISAKGYGGVRSYYADAGAAAYLDNWYITD